MIYFVEMLYVGHCSDPSAVQTGSENVQGVFFLGAFSHFTPGHFFGVRQWIDSTNFGHLLFI